MTVPATQPVQPAQPPAAPPATPPAPAAPPQPQQPAPGTPGTITFDPQTGEPVAVPVTMPPATSPQGVWATGVQPPPGIQITPPGAPAPVQAPPVGAEFIEVGGVRYFSQGFLEQARSEERTKMHTRVETIENELRTSREAREAELQAERDQAAAAAAEAERARIAALPGDEKITELAQTWERRWAERDEKDARQDAIRTQEERLRDLNVYRDRRVGEEADLILPQLRDTISGFSEDEIETAITNAKNKTDAIVSDLQASRTVERQQMRGVAPTGAPPVLPSEQTSGQQTVSAIDIAAMSPAEYAQNRNALLAAASQRAAAGGLYQP